MDYLKRLLELLETEVVDKPACINPETLLDGTRVIPEAQPAIERLSPAALEVGTSIAPAAPPSSTSITQSVSPLTPILPTDSEEVIHRKRYGAHIPGTVNY